MVQSVSSISPTSAALTRAKPFATSTAVTGCSTDANTPFVEVNASLASGTVGIVLDYGELEGVAGARLGVGARHAE